MYVSFPEEVDESLWDEACRRAEAIRRFLMRRSGKVAAGDMALVAAELEVSRATAYRLLKLFRVAGEAGSLGQAAYLR
jgi:putative transposase